MFTRQDLKAAANSASYQRGQQYFKGGSVGKISRENNTFKARVEGSERYKVRLTVEKTGASYRCNCPYDYDGICKHAVALGLAVLQKFGASIEPIPLPDTSPKALETALRATAPATQLVFLADLLRAHPKLRERFLLYLAPPAAKPAPAAPPTSKRTDEAPEELSTIEEVSTEVYEALADLVFDDDALRQQTDYYGDYLDDEGDGMLELADEIIGDVLKPFARLVAGHLAQGRLTRALEYWIGVYEGATAATDPADDDYGLFSYEGYPARVLDCWNLLLSESGVDARLTQDFGDAKTEAALALLFDRYAPQGYPPDYFADLLAALTRTPTAAARLRPRLEAPNRPLSLDQAHLLLHSAEVLADDALWLRTAEAHAGQDFGLLQRLLDYYRQHHDRPNELRLLRAHREQFSHRLNPYLLEHLTLADDADLYLAALEQRCRSTQSLADYEQLRPHWSEAQRRQFVDEQVERQRNAWGGNPLFGAQLLVAENREPELLAYLLARQWLSSAGIPELLTLVARTQPEACLDAVMERTEQALANSRGRDVYQRITSWLLALNECESLRPGIALFATHLYAEHSRLNALREELRAAKLVKTERIGKQYRLVPPTPEDDELRELLRDRKKR